MNVQILVLLFGDTKIANEKNDIFRLTLRPGLEISGLSIEKTQLRIFRIRILGHTLGYRAGIETEFVMPFNKRKWSILVEPTYHFFQVEKATDVQCENMLEN